MTERGGVCLQGFQGFWKEMSSCKCHGQSGNNGQIISCRQNLGQSDIYIEVLILLYWFNRIPLNVWRLRKKKRFEMKRALLSLSLMLQWCLCESHKTWRLPRTIFVNIGQQCVGAQPLYILDSFSLSYTFSDYKSKNTFNTLIYRSYWE